jgi:hypothetical protein
VDDLDTVPERLNGEVNIMYKANPKSNGTRAAIDKHTADCIRRMIVRIGFDVVHKKTGKLYTYIRDVIDCTNATDGRKMALYMNDKHELFVRERNEFHARFEKVEV